MTDHTAAEQRALEVLRNTVPEPLQAWFDSNSEYMDMKTKVEAETLIGLLDRADPNHLWKRSHVELVMMLLKDDPELTAQAIADGVITAVDLKEMGITSSTVRDTIVRVAKISIYDRLQMENEKKTTLALMEKRRIAETLDKTHVL
tara:strand:+ start:116 stop:553 length:438 start_codon:yes stop_codon:yes gene_type:complete